MADRNLDAYYYSFDATGCDLVDAVLEQVARAGKAFHCTSDWNEDDSDGQSPVAKMQAVANASAQAILALIAENDQLEAHTTLGMSLGGTLRVCGDHQSIMAAQDLLAERDQLRAEVEGLRTVMASARDFILNDARVRHMCDETGDVSPLFPKRKGVMTAIDAAMSKGGRHDG